MYIPNARSLLSRTGAGPFVLASAALAGCSGYYPLGEASQTEQFLATPDGTTGADRSALLAAPDVTLDAFFDTAPGTLASVGDLDGDGRDEMALATHDIVNGGSIVHLRYGRPRPADALEQAAFAESDARLILGNDLFARDNLMHVFAAGDVDADGYDDLLLKTAQCTTTQPPDGAYLVYGGPERLNGTLPLAMLAAHFTAPLFEGDPRTDTISCGGSAHAAGAGDLDGDGTDDFVLTSSPRYVPETGEPLFGTGEGVYIFYGRAARFSGSIPFSDADAILHVEQEVSARAAGDVNGDGLPDLLVGNDYGALHSEGSYLLAGRATRYAGTSELELNATALPGAYADVHARVHHTGDIDGDGLNELLLRTEENLLHLFYGAPGLFEAGFDFARADAVMQGSAERLNVYPVGDRNADGADELLEYFPVPDPLQYFAADVAIANGSQQRLSGSFSFPEREVVAQTPGGRFPSSPERSLEVAIPAGDLDGDGAADLFTLSKTYDFVDDGGLETGSPQLHIHYGTPGVGPLR
jgi:FG-GAP repeat protein